MLGRVLNTHQQWLCRRLADLGCVVTRQVAVPDTAHDIQSAVREALGRADLIITTGGLGPTSDDLTRDLIAQLLGKKLRLDEAVLDHIKRRFVARNLPMPKTNEVQALVPEGAGAGQSERHRAGAGDGNWFWGLGSGVLETAGKQTIFPRSKSQDAIPQVAYHAARPAARVAPDVRQFCRAIAPA